MSENEQYDHEKIQAEIAKLIAETFKMGKENSKLAAETAKANAEALKISREHRWYPYVTGAAILTGVVLASVAFTKAFL